MMLLLKIGNFLAFEVVKYIRNVKYPVYLFCFSYKIRFNTTVDNKNCENFVVL